MPFAAALSTNPSTSNALMEVCQKAAGALDGPPDLAVVFFSPHHLRAAGQMIEILPNQLKARALIGCSAVAVAGADQEIEDEPALSLWLGRWKKPVEIESFHLTLEQTSDGYSLLGWPDGITEADPAQSTLLLLGDPFTFPTDTAACAWWGAWRAPPVGRDKIDFCGITKSKKKGESGFSSKGPFAFAASSRRGVVRLAGPWSLPGRRRTSSKS
jgi:FIST N domain